MIKELILPGESISDFLKEESSIKEVKNSTLSHRTYRSACKSCKDFQGYSSCGKNNVIVFCSLSKKTHCKEFK